MNEFSFLGKVLIIAGAILILLGILFALGNKIPWFGKLPGDMVIERKNFTLYFPLATCILISLVLSLFFWIWPKR